MLGTTNNTTSNTNRNVFKSLSLNLNWKFALILLLFEYLFLSLNFNATNLHTLPGFVAIFGHLGTILSLLLSVITAGLLFGIGIGKNRFSRAQNPQTSPIQSDKAKLFLVAHLSFFVLFAIVSDIIFNLRSIFNVFPWLWISAWFLLGALSLLALILTVVSWDTFKRYQSRIITLTLAACGIGTLAWLFGHASAELWTPLSLMTLVSVKWMLLWFSDDITYDPSLATVGIDHFWIEIAPVCSGYETIGLITVFMLAYFWWNRNELRFPRVFWLLPIAITLVWVANVIRITALIMIGRWISPDIALEGFHSQAGWVFFCAIALGLVSVTRYLTFFNKTSGEDTHIVQQTVQQTWNPTAAYLIPLLAILGTALVSGLFIVDFNFFYPLQIIAGIIALLVYQHYFTSSRSWSWSCSWQTVAIGVIVFFLWIALEPEPNAVAVATWQEHLYSLPPWVLGLWLVFRVFGSVVIIPIAEELAFRGYLLRRLVSARFTEVPMTQFTLIPFVASSLIFGMLHQNYMGGVIAGALYALAQLHRGKLSDAILAHAITNGLIAGYALATGSWNLWM